MTFTADTHAVQFLQTNDDSPPVEGCISDANIEFSNDLAHHLSWLGGQKPYADVEFALTVGLNLLNTARANGADFSLTQDADGQFVLTKSH